VDTHRLSSLSTMQMADSSLMASTIMWGARGFKALTSRGMPSAVASMVFRPYCREEEEEQEQEERTGFKWKSRQRWEDS